MSRQVQMNFESRLLKVRVMIHGSKNNKWTRLVFEFTRNLKLQKAKNCAEQDTIDSKHVWTKLNLILNKLLQQTHHISFRNYHTLDSLLEYSPVQLLQIHKQLYVRDIRQHIYQSCIYGLNNFSKFEYEMQNEIINHKTEFHIFTIILLCRGQWLEPPLSQNGEVRLHLPCIILRVYLGQVQPQAQASLCQYHCLTLTFAHWLGEPVTPI